MYPAYSVILFTTASGAGYGLLASMAYFAVIDALPPHRWFGVVGLVIAFALIVFGLLSSVLHLGRPERIWRAFSQWRTSWLSREGILAVATFGPALLFAWGWVVEGNMGHFWRFAGIGAAALASITVYSTGMIYATLRTVRAWFTPYTVFVYLAFAAFTGMLWLNFLAHAFGLHQPSMDIACLVTGAAAFLLKRKYWIFIDISPIWVPVESATGLHDLGPVRLLEAPSTQETFVQSEMGYRIARKHAVTLRKYAFFGYCVIPLIAGLVILDTGPLVRISGSLLMLVSALTGTLIERWLFFAEAKHVAALYFGTEET